MLMKIFSIFDDKTKVYSKPFYDLTIGAAIRNFADASNDPNTHLSKHPGDFSLFLLGEFDDETGELFDKQPYQNLGNCLQHIQTDENLMEQLNIPGT